MGEDQLDLIGDTDRHGHRWWAPPALVAQPPLSDPVRADHRGRALARQAPGPGRGGWRISRAGSRQAETRTGPCSAGASSAALARADSTATSAATCSGVGSPRTTRSIGASRPPSVPCSRIAAHYEALSRSAISSTSRTFPAATATTRSCASSSAGSRMTSLYRQKTSVAVQASRSLPSMRAWFDASEWRSAAVAAGGTTAACSPHRADEHGHLPRGGRGTPLRLG